MFGIRTTAAGALGELTQAARSRRSQTAALRLPSEIASVARYGGRRVYRIPYGAATQLEHVGVDRVGGDVGMAQQLRNRAVV